MDFSNRDDELEYLYDKIYLPEETFIELKKLDFGFYKSKQIFSKTPVPPPVFDKTQEIKTYPEVLNYLKHDRHNRIHLKIPVGLCVLQVKENCMERVFYVGKEFNARHWFWDLSRDLSINLFIKTPINPLGTPKKTTVISKFGLRVNFYYAESYVPVTDLRGTKLASLPELDLGI
jgi:hypothetical protein